MSKIKVYYDFQILLAQKYGGISRYHYELIRNMNPDVKIKVKCLFNRNKYFEKIFNRKAYDINNGLVIKFVTYLNGLYSLLMMRGCNVVHPTYYSPYIFKGLNRSRQKLVITVHDMIQELYPDMFPKEDVTAAFKKKMIYMADHIIAISENTKRDILRVYPNIPEDKITVVYHGNSFHRECVRKIDLPEKFVLFVGNRGGYKNFNTFFQAFKMIMEEEKNVSLVCVGGGSFTEEEKRLLGIYMNRVIQIHTDDETLAYIYSKAECFVFPSLYEGFGFPTLEAFSCECPVLLSETSSMPEVGGRAAVYFNPYDINDIYEKMKSVIYNEKMRKNLIEMGKEQLKKFKWSNTAEETLRVYRKVLEENARK